MQLYGNLGQLTMECHFLRVKPTRFSHVKSQKTSQKTYRIFNTMSLEDERCVQKQQQQKEANDKVWADQIIFLYIFVKID